MIAPVEVSGAAAAIARVEEIKAQLAPPPPPPSGGGSAASPGSFASALAGAQGGGLVPGEQVANGLVRQGLSGIGQLGSAGLGGVAGLYGSLGSQIPVGQVGQIAPGGQVGQVAIGAGTPIGTRVAQIAAAELGVAEAPPGSNDAPRIAQYRTATPGSGVGPWCAYFTSWVAAQAGVPIGSQGQGHGWVPDVTRWGQQTGRFVPAASGAPAVGDLVIFDRNGDGLDDHIGVVTNVRPDGGFETVEGNSSDAVSARSYGRGEAVGFVRLG